MDFPVYPLIKPQTKHIVVKCVNNCDSFISFLLCIKIFNIKYDDIKPAPDQKIMSAIIIIMGGII